MALTPPPHPQVDYVDLWLLHWPGPGRHLNHPPVRAPQSGWWDSATRQEIAGNEAIRVPVEWTPAMRLETWRHMAAMVAAGKAKAIGMCNVSPRQLRELLAFCDEHKVCSLITMFVWCSSLFLMLSIVYVRWPCATSTRFVRGVLPVFKVACAAPAPQRNACSSSTHWHCAWHVHASARPPHALLCLPPALATKRSPCHTRLALTACLSASPTPEQPHPSPRSPPRRTRTPQVLRPAVVQNECHPLLPATELRALCASQGVVFQAYASLGSEGLATRLRAHPAVLSVAKAQGCTPAQALVRWAVQHGCAVAPKSVSAQRRDENLAAVVSIPPLSAASMAALDQMGGEGVAGQHTMVGWLRERDPDAY